MMNILRTIRNYYFYCGIEREAYNAVKREAYISNFRVWRLLHFLMAAVFGLLCIGSWFNPLMEANRFFYLATFNYFVAAIILFYRLREDSLAAQLIIYLSISVLFLFACFICLNRPESNATTFIVLLVLAPMFMIDKPYFMALELCAASAVFLYWMHGVKPSEVWQVDFVNAITFTVVGCFLNIIANSIRIKEFVLTREIRIQKDTDEMTGLMNKGALTREINAFLTDASTDKGLLLMLDVDRFKSINDVYGHDIGDRVIVQLGHCLGGKFPRDAITGRFGGDEFIVFIKNTDDVEAARAIAADIVAGVSQCVTLPDKERRVSISIGIAVYHGQEKNYSEIFKKADIALYQAKADSENRFYVYEQ